MHAHLAGGRVDPPLVTNDRPVLFDRVVPGRFRHRHGHAAPSPAGGSSTISASTTSSSADCASAVDDASPVAPAACACVSAYIACPSFWLTVASRSVALVIAAVSSPSSAFLTSAIAGSTSLLTSAGTLSPFSVKNFSVW